MHTSLLLIISLALLLQGCTNSSPKPVPIVIHCDTISNLSPNNLEQYYEVICSSESFITHKYYHGDGWILDSTTYKTIDSVNLGNKP